LLTHQGLVTGLSLAPNSIQPQQGGSDPTAQLQELLALTDWVRYSLAGNLRSFPLRCHDGVTRLGGEARAHGLPLAYGALPHENVAFIGCHDNLTIFDQVTEKAALTVSAAERSRMVMLCLSMIALSQGVPFFHAGKAMEAALVIHSFQRNLKGIELVFSSCINLVLLSLWTT
jgi:hypothetical protein